jgi:alanine racemase
VGSILRANIRAYAALGAPVAAVVKNNAYGWGVARVAREIDDVVESYFVGDESEFWGLRMRTRRPIRLLAPVAPQRIAALCSNGGVPNVTTREGVAAAAAYAAAANRPVTIRVGIVDAAGWSGIRAADAAAFGALCADRGLRIELWTHITSPARRVHQVRTFDACVAAFRSVRAAVAGTDIASTAWASAESARDRLRIGIGVFGARLGGNVAPTCAIRVDAPVVDWYAPGIVGWAGYGDVRVPVNCGVAVVRCGYGDGFPKKLAGADDILSVGMQYTTCLADSPRREHALIDERSDLDLLADRLGVGPHEIITGLAHDT